MKKFHSTRFIITITVVSFFLICSCESQPKKDASSDAKGKSEISETQKMVQGAVTKEEGVKGEQREKDSKAIASSSHAAGGFQDIQFGTSYKEAQKILKSKFPKNKFKPPYNPPKLGKQLWAMHFKAGGRNYILILRFDHNDKFYSYSVTRALWYPADKFSSLYEEGDFLVEMFKNKYGQSVYCFEKPSVLDIRSGQQYVFCLWEDVNSFISVVFQEEEFTYTVKAIVTDKMMKKEFDEYSKNAHKRDAAKGAKRF